MKQGRRIGLILLLGACLFAAGVASAIGPGSAPLAAPDYQAWFTILVGLVTLMIGAFAGGQSRRMDRQDARIDTLERTFNAHQLAIAKDHPTKADLARIENKIDAFHRRFDKAHIEAVFAGDKP